MQWHTRAADHERIAHRRAERQPIRRADTFSNMGSMPDVLHSRSACSRSAVPTALICAQARDHPARAAPVAPGAQHHRHSGRDRRPEELGTRVTYPGETLPTRRCWARALAAEFRKVPNAKIL